MTEVFIPKVRGTIVTNRLMSDLSWLKVGGKVDYLFQPADLVDLSDFLKNISKKIPIFMIGVCSNLIVRDGGIRGVVIKLGRGFNGIELLENNRISVGAATLDAHVAKKATSIRTESSLKLGVSHWRKANGASQSDTINVSIKTINNGLTSSVAFFAKRNDIPNTTVANNIVKCPRPTSLNPGRIIKNVPIRATTKQIIRPTFIRSLK